MEKKKKLMSTYELSVVFKVDRRVVNRNIKLLGVMAKTECGCRLYELDDIIYAFIGHEGGKMIRSENNDFKMLRRKDIAKQFNVDPGTISRWLKKDSEFPKPYCVGPGGCTKRWLKSDIEDYLDSRYGTVT